MSSYDFILDSMRYSYSSASSYENCAFGFKLNYIDNVPQAENFYGEFGTLSHSALEGFFRKEMDAFELSEFFVKNFKKVVRTPPPPYPLGMIDKYMREGLEFFDNFSFDLNNYEVLLTEGKIYFTLEGAEITAKPDLVLKDKRANENILFDFKTSAPFRMNNQTHKEVVDKKKMEGYYTQSLLYAHALSNYRDIPINKIVLWFMRPSRQEIVPWSLEKEQKALNWLSDIIKKIKADEEFMYNNSNAYFCNNLCGVRNACPFKPN